MKQGLRQIRDEEGRSHQPVAEMLFPMRLNRYLAWKRQSSRRDMDKIIAEGRVLVNGVVAVLGTKINEVDHVDVRFHGNKERAEGHEHAAKRRGKAMKGKR